MTIEEKLTAIAANTPRVYEAGKAEGIAEGKKSAYDEFWDDYQQNGNLTDYANAFSGRGWTDKNFNPKYNIKTNNAYMLFRNCSITDVKGILERNGVILDTSESTMFQYCFQGSPTARLPEIDTRGFTASFSYTFNGCARLVSVDKLILRDDGVQKFDITFANCSSLVELPIEGVIGQNGFDVHWSTKLSKASILSIVNALSTTTTGLYITLSKTAVDKAFATAEGAADGSTSAEWLALVATRSNWTIALA